ncbi:hypothetical protein HDU93_003311 [Gonapodya sp. JEL0774]|nr:hypothetical protein HDU93_003311 [Gonapodya sp. JEL0774]
MGGVSVDGRDLWVLRGGEYLRIRRSPYPVPCIVRDDRNLSWVHTIRNSLKWNQNFSPARPWHVEGFGVSPLEFVEEDGFGDLGLGREGHIGAFPTNEEATRRIEELQVDFVSDEEAVYKEGLNGTDDERKGDGELVEKTEPFSGSHR